MMTDIWIWRDEGHEGLLRLRVRVLRAGSKRPHPDANRVGRNVPEEDVPLIIEESRKQIGDVPVSYTQEPID